jgi:hypothetical protein
MVANNYRTGDVDIDSDRPSKFRYNRGCHRERGWNQQIIVMVFPNKAVL